MAPLTAAPLPALVPGCEAAIVAAVIAPGAPPLLVLFLLNTFLNHELMAGWSGWHADDDERGDA